MAEKRVLVVDDSPLVVQIVRELLESIPGTRVSTETNGQAALARMDGRETWDLVLLDLEMPGMGGLEVLETLKARGRREPVVVVSAADTPDRDRLLADLGVLNVVPKPLDAPVLRSLLESLGPEGWPGSVPFGPTIQRFNGNLDLYRRSLGKFSEEYGPWAHRQTIGAHFAGEKDRKFFLHTLKGVAGYLGSPNIVAAIDACQSENPDSEARFQGALVQFLDEANRFLGKQPPPLPPREPGQPVPRDEYLWSVWDSIRRHDSALVELHRPATIPPLAGEQTQTLEAIFSLVADYEFSKALPLAQKLAGGTSAVGPAQKSQTTILVVDDQTVNIGILREALKADYRILVCKSGETTLKIAGQERPDLILLDVVMPGLSGLETCQALKADEHTRDIPVIFVTAQNSPVDEELGFQAGAVDYIHKPAHPHIIRVRVKIHLQLSDQTRALEHLVAARTQEIRNIQHEVVNRLSIASEYKDTETGRHIHRIGRYAVVLAKALGVPASSWDEYRDAASLHDIGKIGIPDSVLLKPGKLSEEEWAVMKTHTTIGARMLEDLPQSLFKLSAASALTHHEKWDGTGYPQGLRGKDIPLIGRIVAVCDVFDALSSDRPYKKAWPLEDTLKHLAEGRGTHFDPELVDAFFAHQAALVEISRER